MLIVGLIIPDDEVMVIVLFIVMLAGIVVVADTDMESELVGGGSVVAELADSLMGMEEDEEGAAVSAAPALVPQ